MSQDKLSDLRLVLDESIENVVELQDCSEERETLQLLGATTSCTRLVVLYSYSFVKGLVIPKVKMMSLITHTHAVTNP